VDAKRRKGDLFGVAYRRAYPTNQINDAWKKVLFNDCDDLAAGSGVATIYRTAAEQFQQVRLSSDQVKSDGMKRYLSYADTRVPIGVPVVVTNFLSWDRGGFVVFDVQMPESSLNGVSVLDEKGNVIPSELLSENRVTNSYRIAIIAPPVPSIGYRVLQVVPGRRQFASDLKVDGFTLENTYLKLTVDPKDGCITSLYNKKASFETFAAHACGNELVAFHDEPKQWDAWNIDADFEKTTWKLDKAESIDVIEKGPFRAVIRIVRKWQNSTFSEDITLYSGSDYVDVTHNIDWHENHILLKAAFHLQHRAMLLHMRYRTGP
jgi:alpha-mannosidase